MKQILCVVIGLAVLTLAGCTVSPSMLGDNVSGIAGTSGPQDLLSPANANTGPVSRNAARPGTTGSIVPLNEEGAVVDLPYAGAQMQASSNYQGPASPILGEPSVEPDQALSDEERHRRELINRGDLSANQPVRAQ